MRGKNGFILAVASVFLMGMVPFFVSAETVSTRTNLGLNGGYVHDLEVGPDSTAYVGFNSPNGFFFSTDQGTTWSGLPTGMDIGSVANIETSSSSIFVIGGINVYRSQDHGTTWETLSPVDVGNALQYGQGKIFVGLRNNQIAISSDEGNNFTSVTIDSSITAINYIATATTTSDVYVLAQTSGATIALFKSADGGLTWANTGVTVVSSTANLEIAVKPTDANFIVLGGSTPTYTTTGTSGTWATLSSSYSGSILFNGDRIYVGINYTDNNGSTWTNLTTTTNSDTRVKSESIAMDPANTDILYAESMVGVARSVDNGTTWTDVNNSLTGITVNQLTQSVNDPDLVWLAAYGGLAKSTNFTASEPTWTFPISANNSVDYATAVWLDPDNDNYVVSAMLDKIYYSSDSGTTWTDSNSSLNGDNISDFLENNNILYASSNSGVLQSIDQGATWTDTGLADMEVNVLAVDSAGSLYAGVGDEWDTTATKRGVYKYNGTTWTQLTGEVEGLMVNDILSAGDLLYIAAGETSQGAVLKSSDFGATWDNLTANGLANDGWYHALAIDPSDVNILYVSTARPAGTGSVYKTADAGATWDVFYTGLKDETFNAMIFSQAAAISSSSVKTKNTNKTSGLISGTNTGVYLMQSIASLNFKAKKDHLRIGHSTVLTATLKDATTNSVLINKKVKLYKKVKKNGSWHYVRSLKTNNKGKAKFTITPLKSHYYQARWKPVSTASVNSYGTDISKSSRIRIIVRN